VSSPHHQLPRPGPWLWSAEVIHGAWRTHHILPTGSWHFPLSTREEACRLTSLRGCIEAADFSFDLWPWSALACIPLGKIWLDGAMDALGAVGAFCLSPQLAARGEPDPVNGGEKRSQGYRQMIGCTWIGGLGIEVQAYPLPRASGTEPAEMGPAGPVTHCRWGSQIFFPRLRLHLGLSWFSALALYSCLLFLPFLPYHTAR